MANKRNYGKSEVDCWLDVGGLMSSPHQKRKRVGNCNYCKDSCILTKDHKIPKSKGGRGKENTHYVCKSCNAAKGSLTHEEFNELVVKIAANWA